MIKLSELSETAIGIVLKFDNSSFIESAKNLRINIVT